MSRDRRVLRHRGSRVETIFFHHEVHKKNEKTWIRCRLMIDKTMTLPKRLEGGDGTEDDRCT